MSIISNTNENMNLYKLRNYIDFNKKSYKRNKEIKYFN